MDLCNLSFSSGRPAVVSPAVLHDKKFNIGHCKF